jgi:hypothetical protein
LRLIASVISVIQTSSNINCTKHRLAILLGVLSYLSDT